MHLNAKWLAPPTLPTACTEVSYVTLEELERISNKKAKTKKKE